MNNSNIDDINKILHSDLIQEYRVTCPDVHNKFHKFKALKDKEVCALNSKIHETCVNINFQILLISDILNIYTYHSY